MSAQQAGTVQRRRRMFQPDHLNLLVHLLKGNREAIHDQLSERAFDFEGFNEFLAQHRLQGFVYSLLANSPVRETFARDLVEHLKPFYNRQRTHNELLIQELKLLCSAFSLAGHEFILLKGLYLAERFYGGIDRRAFWDIDILVKKDDLTQAAQLLTRSGFKRTSRIFLHHALTIYFTHALDFAKSGVAVDLHWALRNRPSYNFDYQDIWERKRQFYLDDMTLYVLCDEHSLALELVSIFNDLEVGKIRLKSFIDLYMMTKAVNDTLDWSQFLEDRKQENVFKISVMMLDLLLRLFECHSEFPNLAHALSKGSHLLQVSDAKSVEKLLTLSRVGLIQRMRVARLYQASRLRLFLWWIISWPFRHAAYRSGKSFRPKKNVLRLKRNIGL